MRPVIPILCTAVAALVGCGNESKPVPAPTHLPRKTAVTVPVSRPDAQPPAPSESAVGAVATPPATTSSLPPNVVAQVNGRALTMADVLVEVDLMLGGSTSKPPPDKSDKMRQAAVKTVVERFVANTLLLGEADRVGITLTPDDETNAVAALQAMLPPGVTAE